MIAEDRRSYLATVLALCTAFGFGCGLHFYTPVMSPGPDRLILSVQHGSSSTAPFEVWASAIVTRPGGASQPVDRLQIWLRAGELTNTAESIGRAEIGVTLARPSASPGAPRSYACATHNGQTWCSGDASAR